MLERIHKVSEIIAALALVASLIFVGVQISQNTDATRVSNAQVAFQTWSNQGMVMASSDSLAKAMSDSIYPKARAALSGSPELIQVQYFLTAILKTNEVLFLQWRDGHLSDDIWDGYRSTLVIMFATNEVLNQIWSQLRTTYARPFTVYMDDLQIKGAEMRDNNYVELLADPQ